MFPQITPVTKIIIILNISFFLITIILQNFGITINQWLVAYFPISPNFRIWQIFTNIFVAGNVVNLLFNTIAFWSLGPVLEQVLGPKKFIILYLASGLGGFLLYNLWNFYEISQVTQFLNSQAYDIHEIYKFAAINYDGEKPIQSNDLAVRNSAQKLYNLLTFPIFGALGAIYGIITGFSTLFPNAKLMFLFIPFPIKAKYLVPLIISISVIIGILQADFDNFTYFTQLGGALIGFLFISNWKKHNQEIS